MQVLMIPYLYFKDFAQSSGVLHQAMIAKALAQAMQLGGVTVLVPRKADGWVYDVEEYFGGHPNLCTYEVGMAKDQHMWSGFWTEEMYRVLSPMRSPLLFDAVLNMIPPCAMGIKRLLAEVGFSRLEIPVINVFDTVTVPEEAAVRGGNLAGFAKTLMQMEVASCGHDATIVTTASEHRYLCQNVRRVLAPSFAREVLQRVHYVPKPLTLPEPVKRARPAPGEPWMVFMGRSFGKDFEAGGKNGEQVSSVVKAIAALRLAGHDVKLLLCTRSPIDAWCQALFDELGDGLELVHNRPRPEVLEHMRRAHICIDLRDYDALYMAALEQQASGAPTITKASRWSTDEVVSTAYVDRYDPAQIVAAIKSVIEAYEDEAEDAYDTAEATVKKHRPYFVGAELLDLASRYAPVFDPKSYRSLYPVFAEALEAGDLDRGSFDECLKRVLARTQSGSLGRYPKIWALKMMRAFGSCDSLVGGPGEPAIEMGMAG